MNKYTLLALSVSGGILSGMAWMDWCPGLVLLVSFTPFLIIEDHLYDNPGRYTIASFFTYLLPGFVIFCILTLGWIKGVSMVAAVCVILTASLLMSLTIWLAHIVRLRAGTMPWFVSFVAFWLTLEFICLRINILSPWINLGNGLAKDILFIQWYEVTGTAGGTLWILISNLFLSMFLLSLFKKKRKNFMHILIWLIIVIVPSAISLFRYSTVKTSGNHESEVIVVQPDYDPFTEKFTVPFEEQLENAITMARQAITGNSEWVVLPETTVDDPVDEYDLAENKYIKSIKDLITGYPHLNVVAGIVTFKPVQFTPIPDSPGKTGKKIISPVKNYFNSAVKIDSGEVIQIYHKSKLVPGFETVFSTGPLKFIRKFLPELGGTKWGYEPQKERTCFENSDRTQAIAPVICYESIYGKFVTDYVKKGAEAIFIITNDGWWKNTNGYKQHFSYSSLRAIETRRPVVRSANTGISGFIDLRGKVIQKSDWWEPTVLTGNIIPETRITPYVRYGDSIMFMAGVITVLILLMVFIYLPFHDKVR